MPRYLALDVGGGKIEAGLVTAAGHVLGTNRVSARQFCSLDELLADMEAALAPFRASRAVAGLGVGFPALGDYRTGVLHDCSLFPCVHGFPLREHLSRTYDIPVRMTTDAGLFALGVARFGEGRRYGDFLALALGTGLGVALIRHGRLDEGSHGIPDQVLSLLQRSHRPLLPTGHHFPRVYGCDAEALGTRAQSGDTDALAAFRSVGVSLADTILRLTRLAAVQAIIMGGGICRSWPFFAPAMRRGLRGTGIVVRRTKLAHPALLGAVALFDGSLYRSHHRKSEL
jgi:glucokinase